MSRASLTSVRAVVIHQQLLDERAQLGLDGRDEVWDGVLHMVPPASGTHQLFSALLVKILWRIVEARDLLVISEVGVFANEKNYRVPDIVVVRRDDFAHRGIDGRAELVIELLSPGDESRAKLAFYGSRGVREVWLIDPIARRAEVLMLRGNKYVAVASESDGAIRAPTFELELRVVDGPKLRVTWPNGSDEI